MRGSLKKPRQCRGGASRREAGAGALRPSPPAHPTGAAALGSLPHPPHGAPCPAMTVSLGPLRCYIRCRGAIDSSRSRIQMPRSALIRGQDSERTRADEVPKLPPGREWDCDDDLVKQHEEGSRADATDERAARPEGDEAEIPTAGQRTHGARSNTGSMGWRSRHSGDHREVTEPGRAQVLKRHRGTGH
jgi:hypothetical protein